MYKYSERPAIADDVVQRYEEEMLLLAQPQYAAPQKRALRQVEGTLTFFLQESLGFILLSALGQSTKVPYRHGYVPGGSNDLYQLSIDRSKGSAQDFMASDDLTDTVLQGLYLERAP
jgi:hypothetical protein